MRLRELALDGEDAGVVLGFLDWGPVDAAQIVVCVHGLTRNAHDFDALAEALARRGSRVIAVDVAGRGRSSWLPDPRSYVVPVYARQLMQLLVRLELGEVDWIGTSMGGLVGMAVAAADVSPIRRLVLNDIGPFVPRAALEQIGSYVGLDPRFGSLAEVERYLRAVHAGFGPLTDAQWQHLARHGARTVDGVWRLVYDPQIRIPYQELAAADIDLWPLWDRIDCPVLVLRGAESTLLTAGTVAEMQRRRPATRVQTIAGAGHAPALMADDQIETIAGWLGRPSAELLRP